MGIDGQLTQIWNAVRRFPKRPQFFVCAALLCVGVFVFSESADSVLVDRALPSAPAGGVGDLSFSPGSPQPAADASIVDRDDPEALVRSWSCFDGGWRAEWGRPPASCSSGHAIGTVQNCPVDACVNAEATAKVVLASRAWAVVLLAIAILWLWWWRVAVTVAVAAKRPTATPGDSGSSIGTWPLAPLGFLVAGLACQWTRYVGVQAAWAGEPRRVS